MLKAPRPGYVKTRLASEIGEGAAARVYRSLAEGQLRRLPSEWEPILYFAPRDARDRMVEWLGESWEYAPQSEGDLGQRMAAIAQAFFEGGAGGARRLVFLGGDCPGADEEALLEIESALGSADFSVGPARDGGYWGLGMRRFVPEVFREIPWSSEDTLTVTKSRLREAGVAFRLVRMLEDVDDLASLRRNAHFMDTKLLRDLELAG